MLRIILFLGLALVYGQSFAKGEPSPEAVLSIANREIVTLRATAQGASPEMRVRRIHERLRQMDERDLSGPISRAHLTIENRKGFVFYIGDRNMFVLYEADLDEGEKLGLEEVADQVGKRLDGAIQALIEQGHGSVLLKGIGFSLLATVVMFLLLWGIQRATAFVLERLQQRIHSASAEPNTKWRWAAQGWLLVKRVAQLVLVTLWLSVAYLWFAYVLANFPLTQPFAERLAGMLIDILGRIGEGAIASLPGRSSQGLTYPARVVP